MSTILYSETRPHGARASYLAIGRGTTPDTFTRLGTPEMGEDLDVECTRSGRGKSAVIRWRIAFDYGYRLTIAKIHAATSIQSRRVEILYTPPPASSD